MGGGDLSKGSDFAPTGWTCATNYQGTPAPIVCTTAGGEYTLTECEPACTRPTNTAYDFSSEHADCLKSDGTAATCASSLSCADGYSGTITVGLCTSLGDYTVSGCEADCIHPSSAPTGYTKGTMGGDLSKGSDFAPTGWTCASGYSGTIAPQVCTSAGGAYTLTECEPACTRPTNTAYDFSSEHADCLKSDGTAATCASSL